MFASKRCPGDVVSAWLTHETTQMLKRPSPLSVRPPCASRAGSGHVITTVRTTARRETPAVSRLNNESTDYTDYTDSYWAGVTLNCDLRKEICEICGSCFFALEADDAGEVDTFQLQLAVVMFRKITGVEGAIPALRAEVLREAVGAVDVEVEEV